MDLEDQVKLIITSHLIMAAHLDLVITLPVAAVAVVVELVVRGLMHQPMVAAAVVVQVLLMRVVMVMVDYMDLMVAVAWVLQEAKLVVEVVVQVQRVIRV